MPELSEGAHEATDEGADIRVAVADNMRRVRLARGLSLRELATQTGLSKALLSQIERQIANPTVSTLTRLAAALDVSFSELTRSPQTEPLVIRAADRSANTTGARLLFSMMERRRFDVSEGFLDAGDGGVMSDHGRGSIEYGYVMTGAVELTVGERTFTLDAGDAVQFSAALQHIYRSIDSQSTILTVVAYADD
ncbi:MAG: XRE family transcriptional regulator [Actinomycetia bacterium]|nr:XRE family transcriptional regulator [Actinomycetes bacterium]